MDAKTFAGKTVFFILICLFVSGFAAQFGQENSLVGVIVIVLALTLLGKDLSVKPVQSLGMLLASTVAMGLFSFVAVHFGNPFLGVVMNFTFIFAICFVTMRDLVSPMHFPFLLGYTFMLTSPVSADVLPMRIVALMVGSVFIVGLNYVFNHGNRKKERAGIVDVCDEVVSCCEGVVAGASVSPERLERLCIEVNRRLYYHLEDRFNSSPNDRALLDLVVSLQVIGTAVCERERDTTILGDLSGIVRLVSENQGGKKDTDEVLSSIDAFLRDRPQADREIVSALRTMRDELWRLDYRTSGYVPDRHGITRSFTVRTVVRETLRMDSVRFTFSFRMAVVFTLCAFVWQFSGEDDAKALMFATIAMVQPYVEGVGSRTAMRLTGAFVGIGATVAVLLVASGDMTVLTVALLLANYAFTVLNPRRFDVMMSFITFSSLLTASMTVPAETVLTERVAFMLIGVAVAFAANHFVVPYHLRDENVQLAGRYAGISGEQIDGIGKAARGEMDVAESAALVLTAATVSAKLSMNLGREDDFAVGRFLAWQDSLTARCRLVSRSLGTVGPECRRRIAELVESRDSIDGPVDTGPLTEGLEQKEADLVIEMAGIIDGYRRDLMVLEHIRGQAVA